MRRLCAALAVLFVIVWFPPEAESRATRCAFYYGTWFSGNTFGHYTPSIGAYTLDNQWVQNTHVRQLERERFGCSIGSWWGQPSDGPTAQERDRRLGELIATTKRLRSKLKWTAYYECEGNVSSTCPSSNPSSAKIASDLQYLWDRWAQRREWLRDEIGRPVLFVYAADDTTCEVADRWRNADLAQRWHVVLKVFSGYASCANQPGSWHQYSGASAYACHPPHSCVISPGFWLHSESTPRLSRDPVRWRQNVRDCISAPVRWCLVVSFNEWGEGTAVESATAWPSNTELGVYGDILSSNGKDPVPAAFSTIAAAGDIAAPCTTMSPANAMATSQLLVDNPPTYVLPLGDLVYDHGEAANITNCYNPTWGRVKSITKPSPGNHDWENPSGYRNYWTGTPDYYAFDCGSGWRCYSLNSQISVSLGSAQNNWLRADLAANSRVCTLAYWHYPRYSSGNYSPGISSVQPLLDALVGVDVVLNGHDHTLEVFAKRNGYRQFIVGTGGRNHYSLGTPQPFSEVRNNTTFGVMRFTLHSGSYDWTFQPIAGQTFTTSGSDTCG